MRPLFFPEGLCPVVRKLVKFEEIEKLGSLFSTPSGPDRLDDSNLKHNSRFLQSGLFRVKAEFDGTLSVLQG